MPSHPRERHTTYLVAPTMKQVGGTVVYAVRMRSAAEALAAVAGHLGPGEQPVIVGSLSTRTAKAMGLKLGEMRPV